ncbi:hypothetical protein [Cronobacter sakazakii]|uniref:hypothetical protein n=1 Tax=Cronobacter sakazakii TaxID=28141 RepID=UPI0013A668EA|nr:hypothetical protein [Cronobacter sakazakii]
MKELSGTAWVNKFQGSASTETLSYPFRTNVEQFFGRLTASWSSSNYSRYASPTRKSLSDALVLEN